MKAKGPLAVWLVVITALGLIAVATWLAPPRCDIKRSRESVLRQNLDTLRKTIDAYTFEKRKLPQRLEDLIAAGYLGKIPADPMTGRADWKMADGDVHSASPEMSTEGTPYNTW